jgi:hypothetical protein
MAISASKTRLAYVAETAWGQTPATPIFQNMRFTSESLNAEKQTVTSDEIRPDRNVSDVVQTSRMASGDINDEFSYGSFDDLFESALYSTWATDVLKNGTTEKSFLFEKTFVEDNGTEFFHRFAGGIINTMAIGVTAGQLVTCNFGVMAKGVAADTAIITGATYTDATTTPVLSAATDFASLTIPEVTSAPAIQSITMDVTNNLRQRQVVGSLDSAGIGSGRFAVTGTMNAYFEGGGLYDKFLSHEDLSLSFLLGTVAGSRYLVSLPKVKITSGTITAGGNDQDVMANLNWQAIYDGTADATLQITRGQ